MNDTQLKTLADKLKIDFLLLQKIYQRFQPKDESELIKLANDVSAVKSETSSDDIDQILNFYQNSLTQPPAEIPQSTIVPQVATQPVVAETPVQQAPSVAQPQSASINFEQAYPQGYQFQPSSSNDLTGQCAWFAQQVTRLPDGSTWTIGNTIDQKREKLSQYAQAGAGFLKGQEAPQVGNSVILDTGTPYGHVAVVSEVLPDGRIRLTESNWDNNQTVRHDRIIDPNEPNVVGFVKTAPTPEFKIEPPKTPPAVPSTPEKIQPKIDAPQGRQELPVEQQPVKPIDVQVGNSNTKKLEPQIKQEPIVVPQKRVEPVIPKQEPVKEPDLLSAFTKSPVIEKPKEVLPVSPIRKPPEIVKPKIEPKVPESKSMMTPKTLSSAFRPKRNVFKRSYNTPFARV